MSRPRVLILSASIGEGHDGPARRLAEGLAREALGVAVEIRDGLRTMGPPLDTVILGGSPFHSRWGNVLFDVEHRLVFHVAPVRALTGALLERFGAGRLLRLIAAERPDVVVSTYPAVTEVLGRLRARRRLGVPVVAAITDLAELRMWAHPGVDVHLVTHPESGAEVRVIAGERARVVAVTGLSDVGFGSPPSREAARGGLDLGKGERVVVVSGGGWAVGDLDGAAGVALAAGADRVLVLCGRREDIRARVAAHRARDPRVRALGFVEDMPGLLVAADALVHSTAGLTVLEALVVGCPAISYGWGRAHIRMNNRAFAAHGLADVARTPGELRGALGRALAAPRTTPYPGWAEWPSAASVVLGELPRGRASAGPAGGGPSSVTR